MFNGPFEVGLSTGKILYWHSGCGRYKMFIQYTPYEGFSSANQVSRKLGVFDRKLEESTHYFTDILINIRENRSVILN